MPDAILLAGGGGLTDGAGAPGTNKASQERANKAFLEAAGRPFIWYVARAVAGAEGIGRVVAVGPEQAIRRACGSLVAETVPEAGTIMDNVMAAVPALPPADRVLVCATDIPLLTAEAVEEFLSACTKEEADFYYAIVPQAVLEDRYPGARKTFVRVLDGSFTGGSVMLFNPAAAGRLRGFVEKMLAARKKPWLMASLFGWSTVTKMMSGRLSIREVEQRASEVTGIVAKAVVMRRPELALDADEEKPQNLEIIRAALASAPPA